MWYAQVIRNPNLAKGPGQILLFHKLFDTISCKGAWPCMTGGAKLDPHEYGALTPTLTWQMIEPIEERQVNEDAPTMRQAIIVPRDSGVASYPKRTFYNFTVDPFRIHPAGTSTGCIIVPSEHFTDLQKSFNNAYAQCAFPIHVINHVF